MGIGPTITQPIWRFCKVMLIIMHYTAACVFFSMEAILGQITCVLLANKLNRWKNSRFHARPHGDAPQNVANASRYDRMIITTVSKDENPCTRLLICAVDEIVSWQIVGGRKVRCPTPLHDYFCPVCDRIEEHYTKSDRDEVTCGCGRVMIRQFFTHARAKSAVFPFTTTHIDGKGRPIVVEDIGHLRSLERQYGVALTAFSQNPNNPDPIDNPPIYRGWGTEDH